MLAAEKHAGIREIPSLFSQETAITLFIIRYPLLNFFPAELTWFWQLPRARAQARGQKQK